MKCLHRKPPELGYLDDFQDAKDRIKRGEKQVQCGVCKKFIWREFWGKAK